MLSLSKHEEANISEPRILTGRCFCGAVEYAVVDEFRYALICHCSQCRRTTGSAFKPFAGIERAKLSLTKGVDALLIVGGLDAKLQESIKQCMQSAGLIPAQ